jgi:hypothetical protein
MSLCLFLWWADVELCLVCSSSALGGGAYGRQRREEQARHAALPGTGRSSAERRLEEGHRYGQSQSHITTDI